MSASNLSASQMGLGGASNGLPTPVPGNVPQAISAQAHEHADFDVPAVKGLQARNISTYGRTTAWAAGKGPVPISKQTIGSYLNFDDK